MLESDWKQLFPSQADRESATGQKVWMMASDGTRQSGPYGVRCFKGTCQGQWDGAAVCQAQGAVCQDFVGKRDQMLNGAAWQDRFIMDEWAKEHCGACTTSGGTEDCSQKPHPYPPRCRDGDFQFHNGFKYVNTTSGKLLNAIEIRAGKWQDAVSCGDFYAPDLLTLNLEIGLPPLVPPDDAFPAGWNTTGREDWVQYPFSPTPSGTGNCRMCHAGVFAQMRVEYSWTRSEACGTNKFRLLHRETET